MADIAALLTSNTAHYCTPPEVLVPMRKVLVPHGSGRRLLDPATNDAGRRLVKPHMFADGIVADGLKTRWSDADCWFNNPPYGNEIESWARMQAYWGRTVGVPGIGLLPGRVDTQWFKAILQTADAILYVEGRLTFWLPIPIHERDAGPARTDRRGRDRGKYFLRRWFPSALEENLPDPFVLLAPGVAVGPELGDNGKPSPAPFPSIVPFWADAKTAEPDPLTELDALRELVHAAVKAVDDLPRDETTDRWVEEAERLLGEKRFRRRAKLNSAPFERLAEIANAKPHVDHPMSVRSFARAFRKLGTLEVLRGPLRGRYMNGRRVDA